MTKVLDLLGLGTDDTRDNASIVEPSVVTIGGALVGGLIGLWLVMGLLGLFIGVFVGGVVTTVLYVAFVSRRRSGRPENSARKDVK